MTFTGYIIELRTDRAGGSALLIESPAAYQPQPGQYLQAIPSSDETTVPLPLFPSMLFPAETDGGLSRFVASLPNSEGFRPGMPLQLLGPLGRGFVMPPSVKRLALAAQDASLGPQLPLMDKVLDDGGEVAVFCDVCPDGLPEAVEINPLEELRNLSGWADYTALTCPLEGLPDLHQIGSGLTPASSTQVLVRTPMPCGAAADCGVCAIPARRGYKLACKDGPVFDWGKIRV